MKKLILGAFLVLCSMQLVAQTATYHNNTYGMSDSKYYSGGYNSFFGFYGGVGFATKYNYNVGLSGGLSFLKGMGDRGLIGFDLFYQQFSLLYDNEANSAKHATGYAGAILYHKSAAIFLTPRFEMTFGRNRNIHAYFTAGVGYNMGGYDTLRKWDRRLTPTSPSYFDSTVDASANIKKIVPRFGFGLVEYLYLGAHWRFTVRQDVGVTPFGLTKTADVTVDNPTRTIYSPQRMNPAYISLHIGICHSSRR